MMEHGRIDAGAGVELAWQRLPGHGPTVVFLPGYRSDMTGDKALALTALCTREGRSLLLFDYAGHGASSGRFEDGTIGRWTLDALTAIDRLTQGPLVLVGSSMGGWIGLLAALARPARVAAFIGIAAAPDFTETLMWASMTPDEQAALMQRGILHVPSAYGDPLPITRALIEDGRTRLLLNAPIPLTCPVRLLQGQEDADVPWETALRLASRIEGADVQVLLVKDGGHRMSRPQDLALLERTLLPLLRQDGA
jgi:pimeloyl-ACP methyl ester carboxylesterase